VWGGGSKCIGKDVFVFVIDFYRLINESI